MTWDADLGQAIAYYREAVRMPARSVQERAHQANTLLLLGEYATGWPATQAAVRGM